MEKASELLLPLQVKRVRVGSSRAAREVQHLGVYRNGDQLLEIVAEGDHLSLKRGNAPAVPLVILNGGYMQIGSTEVVLVPGADCKTEYVYTGSRAYARAHP